MKQENNFWKSVKIFFTDNKLSILSYLLLTLAYFIALEVFNSIFDFDGINYLTTHLRRMADAMLFALPIMFLRKRILVCCYSLIPIAYIIANVWYYRTFYTLMPLTSFSMIENLEGLSDSIFGSMRLIDILIVLPTLLFIVFYIIIGSKIRHRDIKTRFALAIVPLVFCEIIILPSYITHKENEYAHPFGLYKNEITRAYRQLGFINYWIYSIEKNKPVSKKEKEEAADFITNFKSAAVDNTIFVNNRRQNLILILCESFQSWPIGLIVNGEEVTPKFNKLISDSANIIYYPKVLPQIKDGRSADAQLILNTGLLPLELGAAASLYGTNNYPSLAKALKPLGYYSVNMITDNSQYWNQAATSKSYGFDRVIDRMRGDKTQVRSDEELFKRGLDSLTTIPQPFYAQLVTMSGHDPLRMDRKSGIYNAQGIDKTVLNNLVITQYVDSCLGAFISGLKDRNLYDNSIIIITGDHHAITFNKFEGRDKVLLEDRFVPLIVLNSPLHIKEDKVIGQSDIYPSILDIMGVSDYYFKGLGHSIFREHPGGAMFQDGSTIGVSLENKKDSLRNLWKISDILIRSNYFK